MKKQNGSRKGLKAFSLAEALIVLLIVAMITAVTVPILTKKKRALAENVTHGKWACKYIGDSLYSVKVKDIDTPLPDDSQWSKGCEFPTVAKNVRYLWVEVYGAGGGGGRGSVTPWRDQLDFYPVDDPENGVVPRDAEYSINVTVNNPGSYAEWGSLGDIYWTPDSLLRQYCSYYGEIAYTPRTETYTFGRCTYAEGACTSYSTYTYYVTSNDCHNMDAEAMAQGKCQKKVTGSKCDSREPESFSCSNGSSIDDLLAACQAAGHENCTATTYECGPPPSETETETETAEGTETTESTETALGSYTCGSVSYDVTYQDPKCTNERWLPSMAYGGDRSPGLSGTVKIKKGEYLSTKHEEVPDNNGGSVGGYEYTGSVNGDNYKILRGKPNSSSTVIAEFIGGKGGYMSNSGNRCCNNCGKSESYPNASSTESSFCAVDGRDGYTNINEPGLTTGGSTYTSNGVSIINQYFEYKEGNAGNVGSYTASLHPTSRIKNYDFYIGKGGQGAKGPSTSNEVTTQATNGEATYFGWIKAAGGQAEGNSPTSTGNIFGKGGAGGGVTTPNGTPQRNYDIDKDQDTAPGDRWSVNDGANGHGGAIIVSW